LKVVEEPPTNGMARKERRGSGRAMRVVALEMRRP